MAGQYGWWIDWKHGEGEEGVDWEWGLNNKGSRTKYALHDLGKPKGGSGTDGDDGDPPMDQGDTQTQFGDRTHDDFGTISRTGRKMVVGEDPTKTTLDLSDVNSFMTARYAAPGREGTYNPDDRLPSSDDQLDDASTVAGQEAMQALETKFIDELYGTVGGEVTDQTFDANGDPLQGALGRGDVTELWGLDLKRTMKNADGTDIKKGDANWYQEVTRGAVDWEFYRNDNAYKAAWNDFNGVDEDGNTWDPVTGFDGQAGITSIEEIRALNPTAYTGASVQGQGKDSWKTEWEGKYVPKFDPDTAVPYVPQEMDISSTGYTRELGDDGKPKVIQKKTWTKAKDLPALHERKVGGETFRQRAASDIAKIRTHVGNTPGLKIGGTS